MGFGGSQDINPLGTIRAKSRGFVKSFRSTTATPSMRLSLAGDTLRELASG